MKRSKLFLGATACLLAIAGVAASAAHRFTPRTVCYYSQVSGKHFAIAATSLCATTGSGNCNVTAPKGGGGTAIVTGYNTKVSITVCRNPLFGGQ